MRIVISGTHASGKSTLASDFALHNPGFTVLPDPFEYVNEAWDTPSPALFAAQLRAASTRLLATSATDLVVAERGPLDFLAYLLAWENLTGQVNAPEVMERSVNLTREANQHVDCLVVLPLDGTLAPGADEHLQLRTEMNDVLLDLIGDPDVIGMQSTVVEITGSPEQRRVALESLVRRWPTGA
jgi:hypothetical protein